MISDILKSSVDDIKKEVGQIKSKIQNLDEKYEQAERDYAFALRVEKICKREIVFEICKNLSEFNMLTKDIVLRIADATSINAMAICENEPFPYNEHTANADIIRLLSNLAAFNRLDRGLVQIIAEAFLLKNPYELCQEHGITYEIKKANN